MKALQAIHLYELNFTDKQMAIAVARIVSTMARRLI